MKFFKSGAILLALLITGLVQAQTHTETITKEESFGNNNTGNSLVVYNVNGEVNVQGYSGNTVKIEVKKWVKGQTKRALEQGKMEVDVSVEKVGNIIYVYHESPYTEFNSVTGRFSHKNHNWTHKYHYTMDYTIMVPNKASLELSTMNSGDLYVSNVTSEEISVNNLNGAITMENIAGKTYASALNKDINISYSQNPTSDSTYKSLNGDINITVKPGLNANVSFKSLNGDIFTNFDTSTKPTSVNMSKKRGKRGTRYKLDKSTKFEIGTGGVQLDFDLLNGDAIIKS